MANLIYYAPQTPVVFSDSDGDVVLTLQNLGFGAGRISARVDRGAGSKPGLYRVRSVFQWVASPAATDYAEIYLAGSDGTYPDGNVGTADAALASTQLNNLQLISVVSAEVATGAANRIGAGLFEILDRYYSIGVFNRSATKNLVNTANVSRVILTPVPPEVQ